ncbi:RagB/SusD family nutrient uptake outer membrane protein [Maribacter algarum]|nr:RagB/SusD family nutrient uptake outer membrane protein [Maribacter algarum]
MTKYFGAILGVILMLCYGCTRENYLDFQPRGIVIPSKIEDFRSLLDQVDVNLNSRDFSLSTGFGRHHGQTVYMSDNQFIDDDIFVAFGTDAFITRIYLFEETVFNSQEDDADWSLYYSQIYAANVVLEGLESVVDGTAEEIAELRAEARLHRAFAYFNLVNIYGLHYNPATADQDLGVPIRQGTLLEGVDLTRASVQEVYDYLLNDILESIDDLRDVQEANLTFRPSKAGAYGLLAKVYLFQGQYEGALEACNQGLALKNNIRDSNDDRESSFVPGLISFPNIPDDEQLVWFKQVRFQDIFPTDELLDLYEPNDLRLKWFTQATEFFGSLDSDQLYYGAADDTGNYYMGINTTDLYLIRAECHARLGNTTLSNTDLNTLRINRFPTGAYNPISISNDDDLLQFVKDERRREMVGSVERTFDIKRYNLFDDDNIDVTHTLNGRTETLRANSLNWAFPIATRYIQQNPELEQNPRD